MAQGQGAFGQQVDAQGRIIPRQAYAPWETPISPEEALQHLQNLKMPDPPGSPYKHIPETLEPRATPDEFSTEPNTPWQPPAQADPIQGLQDATPPRRMSWHEGWGSGGIGAHDIQLPQQGRGDDRLSQIHDLNQIQMPHPPSSPFAKSMKAPGLPSGWDGAPPSLTKHAYSAEDDINQRADAIEADAIARERMYEWGPQSAPQDDSALEGLEAAGPHVMGKFGWGGQSAQDAPKPTAQEAVNILQQGGTANQPLQLAASRRREKDEYESILKNPNDPRQSMASRGLALVNRDMDEDPWTGTAAKAKGAAWQAAQDKARLAGFSGDQPSAEAGRYERGLETTKTNMPLSVEQARSSGDLAKQGLVNRGQLDLAESKYGQQQNFMDMMAQQRLAGGGGISRMSMPGMGSVSFAPEKDATKAPLLNKLTDARTYLARVGPVTYLGLGNRSDAQVGFDQALDNVIGSFTTGDKSLDADVRATVLEQVKLGRINMDLEDIWHKDQMTPQEYNALQQLWTMVHGQGQ